MSMKVTLSLGTGETLDYHLYQECYENDNVWLQLYDVKDFKIWRNGEKICLKIAIPIEIFRHATEGWQKSQWAQNPSLDHTRPFEDEL